VKRSYHRQDDPPIVSTSDIRKFDNTYDLSKLKKGTCLSQSKVLLLLNNLDGILNYGNDDNVDPEEIGNFKRNLGALCDQTDEDDFDLDDDVESALIPFDERE
jgi:hypothetical protein